MKNLTLLAALAACGMGVANAQTYVTDQPGIANTTGDVYFALQLDDVTVQNLQDQGKEVYDYRLDNVNRNWFVWDNTMVAGDGSYPGVDMQTGGYISQEVGSIGWSGAGFSVEGDGMDLRTINDETHFHMGIRSDNAPASLAVVICDGDTWATQESCSADAAGSSKCGPAKIAIGDNFNDNGATYTSVGKFDTDGEWVAIDITFGDLKRLYPAFDFHPGFFRGNIFSVLAGGVQGKSFNLDAIYLYQAKGSGSVNSIAADANDIQIMVTAKTINVLGNDNAGFELYNISGQLVKRASTSIMGCEDLNNGVYIVKTGNVAKKVILK